MLDISNRFKMLDISNRFKMLDNDISNRFKALEILNRFKNREIKKKLGVNERLKRVGKGT